MRHRRAFTLIELLVVISIIAILVGILLPAIGAARRSSRQIKSATQLRGIHSAMVIFSNNRNGRFPGMTETTVTLPTAGDRLRLLLEEDLFAPDYMINPMETKTLWTNGPVTTDNFSYTMLQITDATTDRARQQEWRDSSNGSAAMMSDRNIGPNPTDVSSIYTFKTGAWIGGVVWNDNHVSWETDVGLEGTRYHDGELLVDDNLFEASSDDDAMMVYD